MNRTELAALLGDRPALTSGARIETSQIYHRAHGAGDRPALTSGARIETRSRFTWGSTRRIAPLSRAGRGLKQVHDCFSWAMEGSPRSHERGAD